MAIRTLAWDAVTLDTAGASLEIPPPVGYRIFVDDILVTDIPNIQNPSAPQAQIDLEPGERRIRVLPYQTIDGNNVYGEATEWTTIQPSGIPAAPQNLRFAD